MSTQNKDHLKLLLQTPHLTQKIFEYLEISEVVKCRKVCGYLKNYIDKNLKLQIQIRDIKHAKEVAFLKRRIEELNDESSTLHRVLTNIWETLGQTLDHNAQLQNALKANNQNCPMSQHSNVMF